MGQIKKALRALIVDEDNQKTEIVHIAHVDFNSTAREIDRAFDIQNECMKPDDPDDMCWVREREELVNADLRVLVGYNARATSRSIFILDRHNQEGALERCIEEQTNVDTLLPHELKAGDQLEDGFKITEVREHAGLNKSVMCYELVGAYNDGDQPYSVAVLPLDYVHIKSRKGLRRTVAAKTCEICGEVVLTSTTAKCGHHVDLCKDCQRDCPGAMKQCSDCELGLPPGKAKKN